jgi:hypothetical protein
MPSQPRRGSDRRCEARFAPVPDFEIKAAGNEYMQTCREGDESTVPAPQRL